MDAFVCSRALLFILSYLAAIDGLCAACLPWFEVESTTAAGAGRSA